MKEDYTEPITDETNPKYWLAQMEKAQMYAAMAYLFGDSPISIHANRESILHVFQRECTFEMWERGGDTDIDYLWHEWKKGALLIYFVHPESDWTRGKAKLITHPSRSRMVNIAARMIVRRKPTK